MTSYVFNKPEHDMYRTIDANRARNRFVVVDPMDPTGLLYLTSRQYERYSLVQKSNEDELDVLIRPGESFKPLPTPQGVGSDETPKGGGSGGGGSPSSPSVTPPLFPKGRQRRTFLESLKDAFKLFKGMFKDMPRGKDNEGLLAITEGRHLQALVKRWGFISYLRLGGHVSGSQSLATRHDISFLAKKIRLLYRTRGLTFTIKYIKVSLHALTAYVAGNPHKGTRFLGTDVSLTASGLPRILSDRARNQIRNKSLDAIRLYSTILSSFRALEDLEGSKVDLSTIISDPWTGDTTEFDSFALNEFQKYVLGFQPSSDEDGGLDLLFDTAKAGPNHRFAVYGSGLDALAFTCHPDIQRALKDLADAAGNTQVYELMLATQKEMLRIPTLYRIFFKEPRESTLVGASGFKYPKSLEKVVPEDLYLGRLALKYEAAGKVRIFAIVDYWTQAILKPIHDALFNLLRNIPCDGTFNQGDAVESFTSKYYGWEIFSFDLTAATDTIPMVLHEHLLSCFVGTDISRPWAVLMTERLFKLPRSAGQSIYTRFPKGLRYTRGQPMGALTSWAILALTHHCLLQLAAKRIGKFPTPDYRILGDDIVIAGRELAESYRLVCSDYGLILNNKGFESFQTKFNPDGPYLTEFAKQTRLGDVDISPVSLSEELSISTVSQRVEMIRRNITRGVIGRYENNAVVQIFRQSLCGTKAAKELLRALTRGRIPGPFRAVLSVLLYPSWKSVETYTERRNINDPHFFSKEAPFVPWLLATYANGILENQQALLNGNAVVPYDSEPYKHLLKQLALTVLRDFVKLVEPKTAMTKSASFASPQEYIDIFDEYATVLNDRQYPVYSEVQIRLLMKSLIWQNFNELNMQLKVRKDNISRIRDLNMAIRRDHRLSAGQIMLRLSEMLEIMARTPASPRYEYFLRHPNNPLKILEDLQRNPRNGNYFIGVSEWYHDSDMSDLDTIRIPVNPYIRDTTVLDRFRARAAYVTLDSMIYNHAANIGNLPESTSTPESLKVSRGELEIDLRILGSRDPKNLPGVLNINQTFPPASPAGG